MKYDVLIIGGGITGCLAFRELCRYRLRVALCDRANDLASGATMANSAIIHAGFDPEPGTKKAYFNVRGNLLYPQLAKELDFLFRPTPSIVVSYSPEQDDIVEKLLHRGEDFGVPRLSVLERDALLRVEPNLSDNARRALFAQTSAIIEPWGAAIAAAENAVDNGGSLLLSHEVTSISREQDGFTVCTSSGDIRTRVIINAAGIFADRIHDMVCAPSFKIHGRKGHYFVLDRAACDLVQNILFPCPSQKGKGILITPAIHDKIMLGPDSEYVPDELRDSVATDAPALTKVREAVNQYLSVPIPHKLSIRCFAGVRPTPDTHDFILGEAPATPGFIDAAGIESPGLASAPAIAQYLCKTAVDILGDIHKNASFNPERRKQIRLNRMTDAEKAALMEKDRSYARIVCKCEKVSEAEVVDAIRRNAGAHTVKGVKKRTGAGFGRCQAGFCQPEVVKLLSRELGVDEDKILYDDIGSNVLIERTKEGGDFE